MGCSFPRPFPWPAQVWEDIGDSQHRPMALPSVQPAAVQNWNQPHNRCGTQIGSCKPRACAPSCTLGQDWLERL